MAKSWALTVGVERWALREPFVIARGAKTEAETLVVRVSDGRHVGLGESVPYARYGETPRQALDAVLALRADLFDGIATEPDAPEALRRRAAERLAAGAARNALDCALWDLQAKRAGRRVADLAGLTPPARVETAVTLSLGAPDAMARAARERVRRGDGGLLKAKLGRGDIAEEAARLRAIRAAAPASRLIIDANEGWTPETLAALDPVCAEIGALFIEQPLPAEQDAALDALSLSSALCADESCHTADDLDRLGGRFQVVNVKLDKTGGLTEAIRLRQAALARGLDVMIGCMVAGSLATAPAFLLCEGAVAADLDGPLLLARDRAPGIRYDGAWMHAPEPGLWG